MGRHPEDLVTEHSHASTARRSLGGHAVENSLAQAGYAVASVLGVALVETARPGRTPHHKVLAQNAWNVIPPRELRHMLGEYPRGMWPRFLARRAVAQLNLRRAEQVVCLTETMAELCLPYARNVRVSPVTVPMDFLSAGEARTPPLPPGILLAPGTVTWYKNPAAAINIFSRLVEEGRALTGVLFGGSDDGSGCWTAVQEAADRAHVPCSRRVLSREEMRSACRTADVVAVPSRMESLSFSMAEALLLGRAIVASRIPAHIEVATRLGREPRWMPEARSNGGGHADASPGAVDVTRFADEWVALGVALGLPRAAESEDPH